MNFGRSGIEQEEEALQATASRAGNRIAVNIMRIIIFILIAAVVAAISLGIGAYRGIIDDSPQITDANIMPLGYASFIYDQEGTEIQKLNSVEGNRVSVSINEIPLNMQHAIVAIEDSRFYEHNGVDPHGMIRAIMVAIQSGLSRSEGASTITQQLLKNNVFIDWMDETRITMIKRKLQEQFLAVQLEESLREAGEDPKQVILENYLNTVNFGSGAYGVQTAAQTYFGKDAKDLTLSECAVLAAIPQNPSQYNPIIYPEDNAWRMKTVLDYMLDQGYITQEDHDAALADNVYNRIQEEETSTAQQSEVYSYFVDELIAQVKEGLMREKGYTEVQANNAIYSGGLKIYSTENPQIQKIMEEEFSNEANFPADSKIGLDWAITVDHADGSRENYSREMMQSWYWENGVEDFDLNFESEEEAQKAVDRYKEAIIGPNDEVAAERISFIPQPQACMTVIDQTTGQVKGIVGGRGKKIGSLTLNRATDSYRQPGSTFMVPSTYGPGMDLNQVNLATRMTDDEYYFVSSAPVHNIDDQHYGDMRIRDAIVSSNNVIAVKLLTNLTPQVGFDYLKQLGFTTLEESPEPEGDLQQALALGELTQGVNNLELTASYTAVANGGVYQKPIFYTKVTDRVGNVLLENHTTPARVFKATTSYLLTNALQDVIYRGTGAPYQLNVPGMEVAGKTGTTNNYVDLTFVGYTPYYTAGIWTGFDTNTELTEEDRQYIQTLWVNVMNRIHKDLSPATFRIPEGIIQATICTESGLLAGQGCTTTTEIFASGTVPSSTCTEHVPKPKPTPSPTPTPAPAPPAEPEPEPEEQTSPEEQMEIPDLEEGAEVAEG
ncbi:MAG: transglycosylase domain-containing protein [Eubacterium sp.]|nr:transglycosylase domain-containing protein [Eubacterium sp.]